MKRQDFLVELGTEELPPKSLLALSAAFAEGLAAGLDAAGLAHGDVRAYATPRRLAVSVRLLALAQPIQKIERRGPPVSAAFKDGAPTRAATAFAESCGVAVEKLGRVTEPKGEFLAYSGKRAGAPAAELMPGIVQKALDALPIARRMRWGAGEVQFVRPVHWLVMLHGSQIVPCEILGLAAGRHTCGHRFHAPKAIALRSPGTYLKTLETRGKVIADIAARRERIRSGVLAAAAQAGGEALISDALLDEVTALVEWPAPLAGRFDATFLQLPREVLISTLQDHQRYFPVQDAAGRLLPVFVAVANIDSRDPEKVRQGNERVVRPRLSDAAFFYANDRKQRLADRTEALKSVTFQARLGSLHDKTLRITALATLVARAAGADVAMTQRSAGLAKCDLLTGLVGEFPELQGMMGGYYAQHDGEPAEVATAITEQYLPRFAGDALPATGPGAALSVADKLDTIVGIFAIGQKPSGAKDPFGLRRAALGVLRILIEKRIDMDLAAAIDAALRTALTDIERISGAATGVIRTELVDDVYGYMMERLRAHYIESGAGITTEMFDAVLEKRPGSPLDFDARLKALADFLTLPDAAALAAANKRISNILRKSGEEAGSRVDAGLLTDPAERTLAQALEALRRETEALLEARRYTEALRKLSALRAPVDSFFDDVMVMADDPAVRANRLALLAALQRLFQHTADLSRLPGN